MSKRKIRKEGYRRIIRSGETHQFAYNEMKTAEGSSNLKIAAELANFPSPTKIENTKNLRFTYVGLLGIIMILRSLGIVVLVQGKFNEIILLIFVLIAIIAPLMGVYAALKHKINLYHVVGGLFGYSIFRTFKDTEFSTEDLYWLIPFIACIALSFYIPFRLKTKYTFDEVRSTVDGKNKLDYTIKFEEGKISDLNDDLIDSDIE